MNYDEANVDNSQETTQNSSANSSQESEEMSENSEEINEMNDALIALQKELVMKYAVDEPETNVLDSETKRKILLNKIEDVCLVILSSLRSNTAPRFLIRNTRNWDNTIYTSKVSLKPIGEAVNVEVNFLNPTSRNKFGLIVYVLGKIYILLATKSYCTKRELFYQNLERIYIQSQLDGILNDIMSFLDTPLHELHIYSSSKGLVYGPLKIIMEDTILKCDNRGGTTIPNNIYNIKKLDCDACLILLIEKDAVFQKLISEDIEQRLGPCLLITGKGFPDLNTRYLLKILWNQFAIPIFALVDPDPWGIEIMFTYRFGSLAMSHQSELLAVPSIRWLGIHPSEIEKFYDTNEPLTKKDRSRLEDLLNRPYITTEPLIRQEIQILLDKNYKAEIEGIETTPSHLTKVYIRHKITHNKLL